MCICICVCVHIYIYIYIRTQDKSVHPHSGDFSCSRRAQELEEGLGRGAREVHAQGRLQQVQPALAESGRGGFEGAPPGREPEAFGRIELQDSYQQGRLGLEAAELSVQLRDVDEARSPGADIHEEAVAWAITQKNG